MNPILRRLEFTLHEHECHQYYLVRDRYGFCDNTLVPYAWGGVLMLMDGNHDLADILSLHHQQHGFAIELEWLEGVVQQLDEGMLLDSPRFRKSYHDLMQQFEALSVREASCAGGAYPAAPDALCVQLQEYFDTAQSIAVETLPAGKQLRGLVVPHIDFGRGGVTEALAYHQLQDAPFDTFIVLGIAHAGVDYPFCAIDKDFATPLGTALCDHELVRELDARLEGKLLAEQYAHKDEHSIEFVAVFLQFLQRYRNTKIVPLICGGFFEELRSGASPLHTPLIAEFVTVLRAVVESHQNKFGKRIGLIASVDLSHVGSHFGNDATLTPKRLQTIETGDLEFLHCIEAGDRDGMHAALARDNNARHVDAHPAVYTLMAAFPELRAQLLEYRQAFDRQENSVVSFAAMSLWS